MKFQFIQENRDEFPIVLMSKILGVSDSGFYEWTRRVDSPRKLAELKLVRAIEDIHMASRKTYGSPRIFSQLKALGYSCSKGKVERLMKENRIRAKIPRKYKTTTDSKHNYPVAENILQRDFSPQSPNQTWGGDITYVWTKEGWLFLAVIIDLFSRQVVGWSMDERITKELTLSALRMAYWKRKPLPGLIHHSDRGSQYASHKYQDQLRAYQMICSMSRKGNVWDNAPVESFFRGLKTEFIYDEIFETREEAKNKIFEWIEVFYNRQRLHSTLGYKTPVDFELEIEIICA